jgi:hypothetical protein
VTFHVSAGNSVALRRKVLVVNESMRSDLLPPNFPPELVVAAFATGREVAWPPTLATAAVRWFGAHGYAVLGTELWLLKGGAIHSLPIGLSGMPEVHGNTINREDGEAWNTFVMRASAETAAYLQSFKSAEIVERGDVYFNVVWVDESDYEKLTSR